MSLISLSSDLRNFLSQVHIKFNECKIEQYLFDNTYHKEIYCKYKNEKYKNKNFDSFFNLKLNGNNKIYDIFINNIYCDINFSLFEELTDLALYNCEIESFNYDLPNLKILMLNNNNISNFSNHYPSLIKLDLSYNKLKNFYGTYHNLKILILNNNDINEFNAKCYNLVELNLNHNKLSSINSELIYNVEKLYLNYNNFSNIDLQLPLLRELYIYHNSIKYIWFNNLYCPNLKVLDVSYNKNLEIIELFDDLLPLIKILNIENDDKLKQLTYWNIDHKLNICSSFKPLRFNNLPARCLINTSIVNDKIQLIERMNENDKLDVYVDEYVNDYIPY